MQINALVTFSLYTNIPAETRELLATIVSWSSPKDGYNVDVAANGSGLELSVAVGIEQLRHLDRPHLLQRDIADKLVALSNHRMTVELMA